LEPLSGARLRRTTVLPILPAAFALEPVTNRNLHYYRCRTRRDNGKEACEVTNRRADHLEAEVWESVRAILSDPERLRADLDAMIEIKRRVSRAEPREEMNHWLKVLADADEKRAKYQRAYAADVMTLADLKARLAELEQECQIAERELASLRLREQEIADLESDRDAVLESYAGASEDALDSLTPEQRHNLYRSLRIGVLAHADGSTEIVLGNLLSYEEGCTTDVTPREPLLPTGDMLLFAEFPGSPAFFEARRCGGARDRGYSA
jgi:hypothetical protein